MAEKNNTPRRTEGSRVSQDRQSAPRRKASAQTPESQSAPRRKAQASESQSASRRTDVIRCEKCGEDYSVTYKRCPFCNERPGQTGIGGRRMVEEEDYERSVNPVQVVGLVISLIFIIAALFIVFKVVGPLIFGGGSGDGSSSVSTSQTGTSQSGTPAGSQTPSGSSSLPGGNTSAGPLTPVTPAITSVTLNKSDITLRPDETAQLVATVTPADSGETVVWTSSDESVATVDQYGNVHNLNKNASGKQIAVDITASCGGKSASCIVRCNSGSTGTGTTPGTGTASSGSKGTIINAQNGLNVRSGPGTTYDKVASLKNGSTVTILEDAGNGWYKIDYGNGQEGYVSSDYVKVS